MKNFKVLLVFMVVIGLTTLTFAQGRGQGKSRGQGKGRGQGQNSSSESFVQPCFGMNPTLNLSAPILIEGKVTMIDTVRFGEDIGNGIHLSIEGKGGRSVLHIGPESYFKEKEIVFKSGDQFKGIVYKGEYNKKPALFAADIEINGEKILLREKNGIPLWKDSLRSKKGQGKRRGQGRKNR